MATALLAHLDGTSGSVTTTDSTGAHTLTFFGNGQLDGTVKKFGTASATFDGVGDRLDVTGNLSDFDFGAGDFTIDLWFRTPNPIQTTSYSLISRGHVFSLERSAGDVLKLWLSSNGTTWFAQPAGSIALNSADTWYHIAIVRDTTAGTYKVYVNGTLDITVNSATDLYSDLTSALNLMSYQGTGYYAKGHIDEVHVVKGTAVWTSDFTPPTVPYADATTETMTGGMGVGGSATIKEWPEKITMAGGGILGGAATVWPFPVTMAGGAVAGGSADVIDWPRQVSMAGGALASGSATANLVWAGTANNTLPSYGISSTGTVGRTGSANIALPIMTLSASGTITVTGSASLTIPAFTLTATGQVVPDIVLPAFTVTATGIAGIAGSASVTLPVFGLSASGVVTHASSADITLPAFSVTANGLVGRVGYADITFPAFTISTGGAVVPVGSAVITLPALSITTQGFLEIVGTASIGIPIRIVAQGTIPVPQTFGVMVMTLPVNAVTEYSNYNFNSMAKIGDYYVGAGPDGIHVLGGNSDNGSNIDSELKTGPDTFGTEKFKRMRDALLACRASGPVTFATIADETMRRTHTLPARNFPGISQRRTGVHKQKRLKARSWAFAIKNVDGSGFDLDEISLDVVETSRTAIHRSK